MSYAWIVIVIIILFLLYQFIIWYNKGGKKQLDAIFKAFNKEKDKILDGEQSNTNTTPTPIHNNNI